MTGSLRLLVLSLARHAWNVTCLVLSNCVPARSRDRLGARLVAAGTRDRVMLSAAVLAGLFIGAVLAARAGSPGLAGYGVVVALLGR